MTATEASARTVPPAPFGGAQKALMLAVLLTGLFMALLDATIVNVAVPSIARDLHSSGATLQLVVSGYTVAYAMLLITGARLGGLFGARRVYVSGLALFTAASLACGLAPGAGWLVAARVVQGLGAAGMVPQVISVIQRYFLGAERAKALSRYGAVIAVGAVVGQVLGGVLVEADLFGSAWRPVFLVNVPIGLVLLPLAARLLPGERMAGGRRLDVGGLALGSAAVLLVLLPLVLGHELGWPAWTWVSLAAGLALGWAFLRLETSIAARGGHPLLDPNVVRVPGMRSGLAALSAGMIAYGGFLFTLALYLQTGLGESALRAGLTFAPAAVVFGVVGLTWRALPARFHPLLVPVGLAVAGVGYATLAAAFARGAHSGAWLVLVLMVIGLGMGAAFSPLVTQALVAVPAANAPDASGLLTTTLQLSQAIGIAVLGSFFLSIVDGGNSATDAAANVQLANAALIVAGTVAAVALSRVVRAAA